MEINRLVRYIAYSLEIFLLYILQQTPGLFPEIFKARPVLLYAAALSISMFENEVPAVIFGLICGLLLDFGFGGTLGIHAIVVAIICFVISMLAKSILKINLGVAIVISICATAVFVVLGWLYQFVIPGYSYPLYTLINHYLPKYLYSLLLFPLIFIVTRGIFNATASAE